MKHEKTEIDQRLPLCTCRKWVYGGLEPNYIHHPKCFKYNKEYEYFIFNFIRVLGAQEPRPILNRVLTGLKKIKLKIWAKP